MKVDQKNYSEKELVLKKHSRRKKHPYPEHLRMPVEFYGRVVTGVYCLTCVPENKHYVGGGMSIGNRLSWHISSLRYKTHNNPELLKAWQKYGSSEFLFTILITCSKFALRYWEQHWMNKLNSVYPNGYNLQPFASSSRGFKLSEETKKRQSESAKRVASDPMERQRRSERAKKQHKQGTFGHQTWTADSAVSFSKKMSVKMKGHPSTRTQPISEASRERYRRAARKRERLKREERVRLGEGRPRALFTSGK